MPTWVPPITLFLLVEALFGFLGYQVGKSRGRPVLGAVLGVSGFVGLMLLLVQDPMPSAEQKRRRERRRARRNAR